MKNLVLASVVVAAITSTAFIPVTHPVHANTVQTADPVKWSFDKAHTGVSFSVSHLVVSDVEGNFKSFDGTVEASKADFSDAKISFTIEVGSISTDNDMRDKHLKSDDFFNAEKFPQIKFVSTSFVPGAEGKYKLNGNLTIRDVTKPVSFDVKYGGTASAFGGTHAGFKAKTTINRFDYNLKWDKATEAGGMVVGKDVEITVNIDLKKG